MNDRPRPRVITGVVMIVLGLIFLADRLGDVPWTGFDKLWPVILIVVGIGKLLSSREDGRHGSGGWLIFVGGLFLLNSFRILTLHQSWPLFIVAAGVSVLFGRERERRSDRNDPPPTAQPSAPSGER